MGEAGLGRPLLKQTVVLRQGDDLARKLSAEAIPTRPVDKLLTQIGAQAGRSEVDRLGQQAAAVKEAMMRESDRVDVCQHRSDRFAGQAERRAVEGRRNKVEALPLDELHHCIGAAGERVRLRKMQESRDRNAPLHDAVQGCFGSRFLDVALIEPQHDAMGRTVEGNQEIRVRQSAG